MITVVCLCHEDVDVPLIFNVELPPGYAVQESGPRAKVVNILGKIDEDLEHDIKQKVLEQLKKDRSREYLDDELTLYFAFTGTPTLLFDWR